SAPPAPVLSTLSLHDALPISARQQNAWMLYGDGLEQTRRVLADFGVVNFLGGNTGTQMGGWFRRPLGSLADLRGLKMRIPGLGRSEEHTSELQSRENLVCRLL